MLLPRFLINVVACVLSITSAIASEPGDYLADGHLKQELKLSHLQLGGFAGRLETAIAIDVDDSWTASFGVGGRANAHKGQLTGDQVTKLATSLAEADLARLPKIIGAAKPVKSPRQIADGASTTITLAFGQQTVTANFADGVEVDDATQKLRQRLQAIESAMRAVTLNAPKPAPQQ